MKRALEAIIKSLSKDEIRFFKLFLNRTQNRNRKDIELFDYMRKKKSFSTKDILNKLKTNANNFYQIKNRLYHELNNSMVWQHIWKDSQSKSFSLVLLSRVYRNKGELDLAFHYLQIAEKESKESELYEVLSIVYTEILNLSHELISIDVDLYLKRKRGNIKVLSNIDEIDLLLAKLMYDIKTKQNYSSPNSLLSKLIKGKYNELSADSDVLTSPIFRIKLFKMYSRLLLQDGDYKKLEIYLVESYSVFIKDKFFNRYNHNEKLTLLTYIANCLYKNKKYTESLKYTENLFEAMNEYDGFLSDKYLFYYYNNLVLNYSVQDKNKALNILDKARRNEVIKKLPSYNTFIYLNTALIYYQLDKFVKASKNISRLIIQDDFLLLDKSFRLRLYIVDIIIKYELVKDGEVLKKIDLIFKKFKAILNKEIHLRELNFLNIIIKKINAQDYTKDIKLFLKEESNNNYQEDDIISYNKWLLRKC